MSPSNKLWLRFDFDRSAIPQRTQPDALMNTKRWWLSLGLLLILLLLWGAHRLDLVGWLKHLHGY
jgi:hypothetical protein